jgi:hypothetical protein
MPDAIDELVRRSKADPELSKFEAFHKANPQVLDFLVAEIRLLRGCGGFSFASLWHYSRWKLKHRKGTTTTYAMNDHLTPFYARAILILHPELNGRAEMRSRDGECNADRIFGTRLASGAKRNRDYSRRLEWADGTSLEDGWRPTHPHVIHHAATRKADIHSR